MRGHLEQVSVFNNTVRLLEWLLKEPFHFRGETCLLLMDCAPRRSPFMPGSGEAESQLIWIVCDSGCLSALEVRAVDLAGKLKQWQAGGSLT